MTISYTKSCVISSVVEKKNGKLCAAKLQNIKPPSSSQASTMGMCSLTLSNETLISLGINASSNEFRNAWILDFGATNHVTHHPNHFKTYSPCSSSKKIVVANGTTTIVTSI